LGIGPILTPIYLGNRKEPYWNTTR
jgi:hypothetical protein